MTEPRTAAEAEARQEHVDAHGADCRCPWYYLAEDWDSADPKKEAAADLLALHTAAFDLIAEWDNDGETIFAERALRDAVDDTAPAAQAIKERIEREAVLPLIEAVAPLFDSHGPVFGSPEWQAAWQRAEAALRDAERKALNEWAIGVLAGTEGDDDS